MEPPALPAGPAAPVRAAPGASADLLLPPPTGTKPFTYHWSRAGASLDERFTTSDDAGGVRLTVSTAQTGDSGVYTLQASNAAGSDTSKIRLEVSAEEAPTGEDPPTFLRRLQDLTVKVGSRTRFLVEIISSTECKLTWYRNERRLLEAERVALARDGNFWCADVAAVSVDDAGRWTCTAENAGGRASCSAHLNVLVPKAYKRPEFVEELRALLTEQGTVSLECKVVGVPTPVLRWFKDSREIKAGDVFALTANAEDPTSLGTYTCEAVNCMGRAYSSSKVHVVGRASREGSARPSSGGMTPEPPPIFTKELEDAHVKICEHLTLGCHVVVPPWPRSVVWYNKEGKVEPGERYHTIEDGVGGYLLEMSSAEWADEGEWKCVATSAGGRVGITTCYVAMDVPKNYRKPRFMENLQAVLTEEGLVSFECKVVGFPTPILSWFKDGQELKPGDVYQLTGTNSLGSYCCIAKNCMGQASSSAELTVEDIQNQLNEEEKLQLFSKNQAPKFLQGLKSVEAKIDEPFRFIVKVAIPPEPSVLWYRDDQPVDESTRCHLDKEGKGIFNLDIQNLEFLDQAEWKCVAMNDFGHSVTSCFLKLIIPRHYKKPRFLENLQAILSDEGAVNLECKVIGVPQPVLKWYKDGEELKPGDIHRIISGQDGTCCLGTYTCEAQNCMGIAASSASLLGFDDSMKTKTKAKEEQPLQRNLSLSTIHEERTSQMYDTPVGDITLDDKGEISFSFDGKEVSVSLYETPDLTEEEALQIVEMYADQLSENVTEHNVVELPPLRFVKETSTSGNLLMEAIIIDVSPDYFSTPEEDLRTEADVEDLSIADENGLPQLSLDQDIEIGGEDYLEKTMALMSEERSDFAAKSSRRKSDSQRSADDFFSLSRDQSLSEEKRDDDTHISESELQSFASARSSTKVKSKSSKKSGEEGLESSEPTKTVLIKDEIASKPSKIEQTKQQEQELEVPVIKPKRERRTSRGSRRSSTSSEKSIGKSREELLRLKLDLEQPPSKPSMSDEEFKTTMNSISTSLTKVINDVQLIERDIILKSELMSSAATASRSLEIISSLITPLSEIHSIAEAAEESVSESREVTSTIFNSIPQPLKTLQQSLTIIEKCIDMESDNKTLVKKTCVAFIETCGIEVQKILSDITSITARNYIKSEDKVVNEIDSVASDITTVIRFSAETINVRNILSEASEIKPEIPTLETKHLKDTQKAIFELKSPLNSLLRIVESAQSSDIIYLPKIKHSEVIMNDMSASIQDLQTALEQIETLSVKETSSTLHKYNTDIIEKVMDSVIKLRGSFEQLSTEPNTEENKTMLKETLSSLKQNLVEISDKIETTDKIVGKFDILQSENKLDVLQKMAQILIALENNLPRLEALPTVKSHMDAFHKNLTKVLEKVIESNDAEKYQTMLEICDTVNIINASIRDLDSENVLPLASLSNTLKIIQANLIDNIIESELNCSIMNNISDVLVSIQEAINKAEDNSLKIDSEYIQDLSSQILNEEKINIILEHIDQTIAAVNTVKIIESIEELKLTLTPALENVCPILEELRKSVASVRPSGVEQDERVSEITDASFAYTIATPLCELNQSIIILNQVIAENIDYIKENTKINTAIAEPLHELHTTLEILQQDVISQYGEDLTPYDVSVNMASVVQNLQSCIVMIQEQAGIEGAEDMSTLEDISGIKTSADTLPSDRLVLPTAEETAIEQSYLPLKQEVATTATAQTLQTLNEHILVLQTPDVIETLDTLSEISDYASLKSVIVDLGDLHTGIEGILHPVPIEGSIDFEDTINIKKLSGIAEPMHEIQQSLSVLDTSNIPVFENILDLPSDKIHSVFQSISELKDSLEQCMCAVIPAIEIANNTIEISNKVSTLREVCEQLKEIFKTSKDDPNEMALPKEVQSLETVVNDLINATDVSKDIKIEEVKTITEELYLKVMDVQEDIIQFTALSSEQISQEAKLIQIVNDVETNIAVLQQYDFIDLSRASDLTTCVSPQLAAEIDSESLAHINDIAENAVNVLQDSYQEIPSADLKIIEDFFKTCKNEFTILRCLITKATSHKKIIRLLQEFSSLQTLIHNFTTERLELRLSDDVNECLTNFLIHADECLRSARNSLIKVVDSQCDMLIKVPFSQLESLKELQEVMENKTGNEIISVIETLLEVAKISNHFENNLHSGIIEELSTQNPTPKPNQEEILLAEKIEELAIIVKAQTEIKNVDASSLKVFEELKKCISKHNYKDALGTGKTLIILKCLAECATIVKEEVTNENVSINEATEIKEHENTLKEVLAEMLQPLQALQTELVNIREQVLSGAEEGSISIDVTATESIMHTMTELHKDILQQIETDHSILQNEDIPLLQEVDKEIHTIKDSIRTMDNVQAIQAVKEITKPMEDIEKSLHAVLHSEKDSIEKEALSKEESAEIIDQIDQYIEIFEIIEEITAAIKLEDITETLETAQELKRSISLNEDIENKETLNSACEEQARLAQKLQTAISALQVQVLDSAQELAPTLNSDALKQIVQVTAQLQKKLVAVTTFETSVQAPVSSFNETQFIEITNQPSIASIAIIESVVVGKTEIESPKLTKPDILETSPDAMKVVELDQQSSFNITSSDPSQELTDTESIKTLNAEVISDLGVSESLKELSSIETSVISKTMAEDTLRAETDDSQKERILVEKSTAEDTLMQHITEYVSEDIVELIDSLASVADVEDIKISLHIAYELRECIAALEIDPKEEYLEKIKKPQEQQIQLIQSLESALSTMNEQTFEKLQESVPSDSKASIQKIVVLIENLKADLESVKIHQHDVLQYSKQDKQKSDTEVETTQQLKDVPDTKPSTEDRPVASTSDVNVVLNQESTEVKQPESVAQESLTKQIEQNVVTLEAKPKELHDETKVTKPPEGEKVYDKSPDQEMTKSVELSQPEVSVSESSPDKLMIRKDTSETTAQVVSAGVTDVIEAVVVAELPIQDLSPELTIPDLFTATSEKASSKDECITDLSIDEVRATAATVTTAVSQLVSPQLEQQPTEAFINVAEETLVQTINLLLSNNILHTILCKQQINVEEFDQTVQIAREFKQFLTTSQIETSDELVNKVRKEFDEMKLTQLQQVLSSIHVQLLENVSETSPSLDHEVQSAANVILNFTDALASTLSEEILIKSEGLNLNLVKVPETQYKPSIEDVYSKDQSEVEVSENNILVIGESTEKHKEHRIIESSDEFVDCSSDNGNVILKQKNSTEVNIPVIMETTKLFEEFFDSPTLADEMLSAELPLPATEVQEVTILECTKNVETCIENTSSAKIEMSDSLATAVIDVINITDATETKNNAAYTTKIARLDSNFQVPLPEVIINQTSFDEGCTNQEFVILENVTVLNEAGPSLEEVTENIFNKPENTHLECLSLEPIDSFSTIDTDNESFGKLHELNDKVDTPSELLTVSIVKKVATQEIQEDLFKVVPEHIQSTSACIDIDFISTTKSTDLKIDKKLCDITKAVSSEVEQPPHEVAISDKAHKIEAVEIINDSTHTQEVAPINLEEPLIASALKRDKVHDRGTTLDQNTIGYESIAQSNDFELDVMLINAITDTACVKEVSNNMSIQNEVLELEKTLKIFPQEETPSNFVHKILKETDTIKQADIQTESADEAVCAFPTIKTDIVQNIATSTSSDEFLSAGPFTSVLTAQEESVYYDVLDEAKPSLPTEKVKLADNMISKDIISFTVTDEVDLNELTVARLEESFSDAVVEFEKPFCEISRNINTEFATLKQGNATEEILVLNQNTATDKFRVENMLEIPSQQRVNEPSLVHIESLYTSIDNFVTSKEISKIPVELLSTSTGQYLEKSLESAKKLYNIMSMPTSLVERQKPVMELRNALRNTLDKLSSEAASEFGSLNKHNLEKIVYLSTSLLDDINEVIFTSTEVVQDVIKKVNELFYHVSDQDTVSENPESLFTSLELHEQCAKAIANQQTILKDTSKDVKSNATIESVRLEDTTKALEPNIKDELVEDSDQLFCQEEQYKDIYAQNAIPMLEQTHAQLDETIKQTSNDCEDQSVDISKTLVARDKDQMSVTNVVQSIEERCTLIEHIDAFITEEVAEIVNEISTITNSEILKESIFMAKKLRESVAAADYSATAEEISPLEEKNILEQANLAQTLHDALSTWQTQALDNAEVIAPLLSVETLQKVSEIISHLQDDLDIAIVSDAAQNIKLGEISEVVKLEELNSITQLETLLQDVNMKINLTEKTTNADESESLRDALDEVQTVIIKLKNEYDCATNDTLNETLEDLECSVRSVQLQINEESPPELLNEACVTLQLLVQNLNAAQQVQDSQILQKSETTENILDKCSKDTEESVNLLDLASKLDMKDCTNLTSIINSLTTVRDSLKTLRESFLIDADTVIENGVKIVECLNQVEENIFALEREVETAENIAIDSRDSIITAVHSVYGSISNMRGTVSSVQKRFMFENFGRPSESLLHSIKNISVIISSTDDESNKASWKKLSKSLRKVLNHFEDIKFYINLDKTARLPSDAAFTKIILDELKDNIFSVLVPRAMLLDATVLQKVNNTLKCVEVKLANIESEPTLQVKSKIPMFKEIAAGMLSVTTLIKNKLTSIMDTKLILLEEEKQTDVSLKSLQAFDEDDTKIVQEAAIVESWVKAQSSSEGDLKFESVDNIQFNQIASENVESSTTVQEHNASAQSSAMQELCKTGKSVEGLEQPTVIDSEEFAESLIHDQNQNTDGNISANDQENKIQVQSKIKAEQDVEKQKSEEYKGTSDLAFIKESDRAASSSSLPTKRESTDKDKQDTKTVSIEGEAGEALQDSEKSDAVPETEQYARASKDLNDVVLMQKEDDEARALYEKQDAEYAEVQQTEEDALAQKQEPDQEKQDRQWDSPEKDNQDYMLKHKEEESRVVVKEKAEEEKEKLKQDATKKDEQKAKQGVDLKELKKEATVEQKTQTDDVPQQKEKEASVLKEKAKEQGQVKHERDSAEKTKQDAELQQEQETRDQKEMEEAGKEKLKQGSEENVKQDAVQEEKDEEVRTYKEKAEDEKIKKEQDVAETVVQKDEQDIVLKQKDEESCVQKEKVIEEEKVKVEQDVAAAEQQTKQESELKQQEEAFILEEKLEVEKLKQEHSASKKAKQDVENEQKDKEALVEKEKAEAAQKTDLKVKQNEFAEEVRLQKEKAENEKIKQEEKTEEKVEAVAELKQEVVEARTIIEKTEAEKAQHDEQQLNEKEALAPKQKAEAKNVKQEQDAAAKLKQDDELQQNEEEARIQKENTAAEKNKPEKDATKAQQDAEIKLKEENDASALKEKADTDLKQKEEEVPILIKERDAELKQQEEETQHKNEQVKKAKKEAEIELKEEETRALKEQSEAELKQNVEDEWALKEKAEGEKEQYAAEIAKQDAEIIIKEENAARELKEKADAKLKQQEEEARVLKERDDADLKQQEEKARIKKEKVKKSKKEADIKQTEEEARAWTEKLEAELKQKEESQKKQSEAETLRQEQDAAEKAKKDAEIKLKEENDALALKEKADTDLKQQEEEARVLKLRDDTYLKQQEEDAQIKEEKVKKAKKEADIKEKEEETRALTEKSEAELKQKEEAQKKQAEAETLEQEQDAAETAKKDAEIKLKEENVARALKEKANADLKQREESRVLKEEVDTELRQQEEQQIKKKKAKTEADGNQKEEACALKEQAVAETSKQEQDAAEKAKKDAELKQNEEDARIQKEEEALVLKEKEDADRKQQEEEGRIREVIVKKAKTEAEIKQKEKETCALKDKADAEHKQKAEEARTQKEQAEAETLRQEQATAEKAKKDAELKQKEELALVLKEKEDADRKQQEEEARIREEIAKKAKQEAEIKQTEKEACALKEKADAEHKQKEEEARIQKEQAEAETLRQEQATAEKAKKDAELKQKEELALVLKEKEDADRKQQEEEARIREEIAKKAKQEAEIKQTEKEACALKKKTDAEHKQKEEEARIQKEQAEAETLRQEQATAEKAKKDARVLKEREAQKLKEKEDAYRKQQEEEARINEEKVKRAKKEADIKEIESRALKEKADAELKQKEGEARTQKEQAEAETLRQEQATAVRAKKDAELKQKEEEALVLKEKEDADRKQQEEEGRIREEIAQKAKKEAEIKQTEKEACALKEKADAENKKKEEEARTQKEQAEAEILRQEQATAEKAKKDAELKQNKEDARVLNEREAQVLKDKEDADLKQQEEEARIKEEKVKRAKKEADIKQKEENARVIKEKADAEVQQKEEARAQKEQAEAETLRQEQDAAEKATKNAVLKQEEDNARIQKEEEARVLKVKEDSDLKQQEKKAGMKKEKIKKAKKEGEIKQKEEEARNLKEKADADHKQNEDDARAQKKQAEAENLRNEQDAAEKAKQDAEIKRKEENDARALKEKEDADFKQREEEALIKHEKVKKANVGKAKKEADVKQKEEEVNAQIKKAEVDNCRQVHDDAERAKQKTKEDAENKLKKENDAFVLQEKIKDSKKEVENFDEKVLKDREAQKGVNTHAEKKEIISQDDKEITKRSRTDETSKKNTKYTERLGKSERRDDELHIYKEDRQTKKENGDIISKSSLEESNEHHYIKEYQYEPSRSCHMLEAREKPRFVDHNHRDYTMEFARPSGYNERSFDVDKSESLTSHDYLGRNAAIFKAQTLILDSQLRSSTPLLLDTKTSRTSEPPERRSEARPRSKAHSEARTITSEKRTGASRDSKRKPVFSTYLTDRTAVEGSRVKLTCSVLSSSDPTVTWYKNGVLLENKLKYRTKFIDGLITLEVLNAVPSDSAEYSCTIQNENGSISSAANLKVYPSFEASPIPPTFTRSIRDTYHLAENELVLECRIRGQPLPTITWLKDDKSVINNSRYQAYYLADGVCRLAIEHPTPEDSGKYTCKAENSVWSDQITHVVNFTGRESRQGPNITTIEKSRFNRQVMESRRPHFTNVLSDYKVVTGGTIGLQVEIRGAPTRVEWLREGCSVTEVYRNAKTFVEQGLYTLALSDVTEKESGMYTCRAWSSQCHVDMNAAITVVQPNELDGKPAIIVGRPEKDILISIGEDVNISFRVQGEPKPKVVFMKGIRDITTSQRVCKMSSDDYVKFTLKRSVVSDAGTYCILARNAYGVDRAFVTVVVRQRASSDNLISDWTYPVDDSALSIADRKYKSVPERIPGEPCVVEGGNNWISLGWPKSEPGQSAPVLAYKVESWLLGKDGGARWSELGITPLNSFDAFNLKQGEEYHFRVTPRNRYGWGESVQTSSPISVGLAGDRPEFTESLPGQLKVLIGETANLTCSVKGTPAPEVVWMKNGHEIEDEDRRLSSSFNGRNCSLTIKDINIEDEARYSCEATNLHGRASTYARLAVVTDRSIWEADAKLKRERSADVDGDYPPQFTMRLRDRRVQATYPVRLTCQVIGSPDPRITWFKDGLEVKLDNRRSHFQDEHFHTLEIAPTNLEDGGVYEAMARNSSGAVSCRCNLVVDKGIRAYVAPEFCCGLEPLYRLTDGEELRISAVVEAYPSVGVTWYRDGVRLRPSRRAIMTLDRDGQIELALAAVTSRDAGVYSCTASNEVGRASTSGKVEVIGSNVTRTPPVFISHDEPYSKEPMFIRKPRSSEAREGDTVIIACEVVGDPKPDVYWLRDFLKPDYYRDSSHFKRMGDGPEYRFEIPHAKLDYTGAYSVVARNTHGEAKAIISLQILAKDPSSSDEHNIRYGRVEVLPRFSKELTDLLSCDGDAVEFECHLTGNPEPSVRWFHYQELIRDCPDFETSFENGAARLKIKQVTAEDEGTYTCEAANNLGKATSSACLVVYPPGEPNTLSQCLRRPPAFLSAASTPRSTPRSTPARSVSRTPGPETRRLCSPARTLAPSFYTYPFNKVAEEGDTVMLQCAIKGNPAPWATWDKDGVIITPSSRITIKEKDDVLRLLEIEQVTVDDVGVYRITIENEFGRQEASARIEVITQKGKFYAGVRAVSPSPRKTLTYRNRRPSTPRQD